LPHTGRAAYVRKGRRLEYFTVAWNSLEALAAIAAGWIAGSIALGGFGCDSLVEVTSGCALLWRLHHEGRPARLARAERTTLTMVGWCFIALAAYIVYESVSVLVRRAAPEPRLQGKTCCDCD